MVWKADTDRSDLGTCLVLSSSVKCYRPTGSHYCSSGLNYSLFMEEKVILQPAVPFSSIKGPRLSWG